jgi:hypothetical protein
MRLRRVNLDAAKLVHENVSHLFTTERLLTRRFRDLNARGQLVLNLKSAPGNRQEGSSDCLLVARVLGFTAVELRRVWEGDQELGVIQGHWCCLGEDRPKNRALRTDMGDNAWPSSGKVLKWKERASLHLWRWRSLYLWGRLRNSTKCGCGTTS